MHIDFLPQNIFSKPVSKQKILGYNAVGNTLMADCFCKSNSVNFSGSKKDTKVEKKDFGVTKKGEVAELYTITNKNGAKVELSNFGATIVSIKVPDKNGKLVDVLQGYKSVEGYDGTPVGHSGGTIGPCANKIGNGKFSINGKEYTLECNKDNGKTHCHGASAGFDIKAWKSEPIENGVKFTLDRKDGEGGYPGNLKATVTYTFDDKNKLNVHYQAKTDKDTVLNMTNHAYFNLDGAENAHENSVYEHVVEMPNSSKYTINDEISLPTGEIAKVDGTAFDFRKPKKIGDVINSDNEQMKIAHGFDQNYCIDGYDGKTLIEVAKVTSPKTGIQMNVSTNLPGFQFYTANHLGKNTQPQGKDGKKYEKRSALCVEPQFYPDAMAKFEEKPILKVGETYDRTIIYSFN